MYNVLFVGFLDYYNFRRSTKSQEMKILEIKNDKNRLILTPS